MIVVLDTNVLVSGLLSAFGAAGRVLDLFLTCDLRIAYDDRIRIEYREVLARPKFDFDPQATADLLDYLFAGGAATVAHPLLDIFPDPSDLPFLEVAAELRVPLITGNIRHFPETQRHGVHVLSPSEFLAWWLSSDAPER